MNIPPGILHVQLSYSQAKLHRILKYVERHSLDNGGRYRLQRLRRKAVATVFCRCRLPSPAGEEPTTICQFDFALCPPAITLICANGGFGLVTAWPELALLEQAALGNAVHGRSLSDAQERPSTSMLANTDPAASLAKAASTPQIRLGLPYSPVDWDCLVTYLAADPDGEEGRYSICDRRKWDEDIQEEVILVSVNSIPDKWAATPMPDKCLHDDDPERVCTYRLHCDTQTIHSVELEPGFGLATAWAELAVLEQAAIGRTIHGKQANGDQSTPTG